MDAQERGKRIRELRKKANMTQTELAEKINAKKETIYKYEKGLVKNIPMEKALKLVKALDTTTIYLGLSDFDLSNLDYISITDSFPEPIKRINEFHYLGNLVDERGETTHWIVSYDDTEYLIKHDDLMEMMNSIKQYRKFAISETIRKSSVYNPADSNEQ